ncbi:MAG: amidohydrolase family protein [Nitrospinota bacterium]
MDLIVRNAKVRGEAGLRDIGVREGRIAALAERLPEKGEREIDAGGRLATPSFANPHIHLDKALLGERKGLNRSGLFDEALEATWEFKRNYTLEDLLDRGGRVIEMAASLGTTLLRNFVDVDTIGGLRPLEAGLELKKRYADVMDVQVCAFPQEAILRNPGTEDLLRKAMEMGADVVGGLPWIERTDEAMRRHIDIVFDIARRFDRDVHMLIDNNNDPMSRSIEFLADKVLREGFPRRVTAGHVEALCVYDDVHAHRVIRMIREAGIHIVSNPHISLSNRGRLNRQPVLRGITRVKELLEAGVPLSCAQDDVMDPYYNFGRMDQLEVGLFMAHAAHLTSPPQLETVYDMLTVNAARAMGVDDHDLAPGNRADLTVLDTGSLWDAFRLQPDRLFVIRGGRVIAESASHRRVLRGGELRPFHFSSRSGEKT